MKKGRAYSSGSFLLKTFTEETLSPTLNGSFIASKKVFVKAVDRNRAKRIMKESFLEAVKEIKVGILLPQFVFLAKKDIFKNSFADIVYDIKQFLVKDYII